MNQKSSMNVGRESDGREVPAKSLNRRKIVGGRLGGKATGQGEHRADDHFPDSELG
jgi:hypothetical protein